MTRLDDSGADRWQGLGFDSARLPQLVAAQQGGTASGGAPPLADRLGGWLGWAEAITLSGVVQGDRPLVPPRAGRAAAAQAAAQQEVARLRQQWPQRLADARAALSEGLAALEAPSAGEVASVCRRHLLMVLRDSETPVGGLRARLRATAATVSSALAHLAVLDAAMDKALAARERSLLEGAVAAFEGAWARRVSQAAASAPARRAAEAEVAAAWSAVADAALDLRFQPVLALAEALAEAAQAEPAAQPAA